MAGQKEVRPLFNDRFSPSNGGCRYPWASLPLYRWPTSERCWSLNFHLVHTDILFSFRIAQRTSIASCSSFSPSSLSNGVEEKTAHFMSRCRRRRSLCGQESGSTKTERASFLSRSLVNNRSTGEPNREEIKPVERI